MNLEAAAQLLATALMLLQSVSANPSLPQSARDEATGTAQRAITAATRAMGQTNLSAPWCKIVSDKYHYRVGEVVVFDYEAGDAAKLEFAQDSSDVFPTPEGELVGMAGQYRKTVQEGGYSFLTLKATNAAGHSAACSAMVSVHEL